ncbi:GIY-YIG nuclease family protein [Cohnella nanjingensis]|uniref:GIY-YIG nuclease family protein n=1 Tax=Cohnella nanjingensis TaxID=1387779 RepID=A0A7X0VDK9_9BACL|nr:GIY-YIG nuclease family protein [Cohnella nanjingensis]MBB6670057.1 GIY-YIG nuclease family protein [Cohnella nanjingensis]
MTKKDLLIRWMAAYEQIVIPFSTIDYKINVLNIIQMIAEKTAGMSFEDSIYILRMWTDEGCIPIYIGRSNAPVTRWKSHLTGLIGGKKLYSRWQRLLLTEDGLMNQRVDLMIVLDSMIKKPPIPGFPCTIGAVEYQLVSLASDAYPATLLNHEGNRR